MIKNLQHRFVVLIRRPQKILSVAQTTVSLSGPSVNKALDLIEPMQLFWIAYCSSS